MAPYNNLITCYRINLDIMCQDGCPNRQPVCFVFGGSWPNTKYFALLSMLRYRNKFCVFSSVETHHLSASLQRQADASH